MEDNMSEPMFLHIKRGTLSLEKKQNTKSDGVATALGAIGWIVIVVGIVIGLGGVALGVTSTGYSIGIILISAAVVTFFGVTILALGRIVEYLGIIANAEYQCLLEGIEGIIDDSPIKEDVKIETTEAVETITTTCPACKNTVTIKEGDVCPCCKFNVSGYLKNYANKG